ncbi:putative ribonuclease H protein [Vitis vinifera]|uniref:Putative ribonuclease H protein n=1 Tax=Vitis vinifera TaxID=29760 RepID=A0A438GYA2_VITVI|nr:putative ribonuclease H protein [Vitis vinifera]
MAKFWVAIESKTFEVSIEEIKGKLKGIIVERSRGFSSWIRFGASGLRKLLECFEECCREEKKGRLVKVWEEEGRKFRLERRGVIGGWAILAVKLRALGIVTKKDDKGVEATQISSKKKDATIDDEEERCSGKKKQGEIRSFLDVAKDRLEGWNLRKGVKVMKMGEPFFLLEFEDEGEAEEGTLNLVVKSFCYAVRLWWEVQPKSFCSGADDESEKERGRKDEGKRDEQSRAGNSGGKEKEGWRAAGADGSGAVRKRKGKEKCDGDKIGVSVEGLAGYSKKEGEVGSSEKDGVEGLDSCKCGCEVTQPSNCQRLEHESTEVWVENQKVINGSRARWEKGQSSRGGEWAAHEGPLSVKKKFLGQMDNRGEKWASRVDIPLLQRDGLGLLDNRPKVVEKDGQDDGPSSFQKDRLGRVNARASSCLEPAEEFFAEDSLIGGMGPAAAIGTPERCSITDECFLEEASRCGCEVVLKEAEEGLSISPLSMRQAEERMVERSTSGFFPQIDGRKEWGEEAEKNMESWSYSCLAKFCHCLGMPTEGCEREILKLLHKMRIEEIEGAAAGGNGGVYGPSVKVEKEEFLSELGAIKGLWNDPWCVAGDFNMIRFPTERSRGGGMTRGPTPFRFENMWLKEEGFKEEERVRELSLEEEEARKEAREMYKKWVLLEETSWRQKSREIWLKEGDRNTRFFHQMANAHRRRNQMNRVKVNGRWYNEEREIKEAVGRGDVEGLEKPFTEEEVFRLCQAVVFECNVPSLDSKERGAEDLKDYRPISLVGGLYKWLAKTLANRMKGVLAKVISTAQNAFVEGRQIMDAVLVANEAIDSIVKSNRGAILCKLDIEKAYDHVDWDFLLAVMEKMGFGERWCRWIKWCLSTVSGWGFLAPCLIRGRRGEGVQISHLLFADDTLIFCEAKEEQLLYMGWLLMWFEAISGLRVNLEKSELIPVGRVENVDELADEFGYRVGKLPSTYLGMPLGAPFKSVAAWDGIEERFRKKLAMWKRQCLEWLESDWKKIQRDFLWGGGALVQKPHLVKWSIVCLDKRSGGLGVKNLGAFNRALLGKWVWRFANERKALWNQVIRGKYGEERGGWRSCEPREAYGLGLWKAISKMGHKVTPFVGFVVGDGEKVKFWKDKWCETIPLSEVFPSLFALASNKEAWINEVWTAGGEGGEFGTLVSIDLSTIGRWKMLSGYFVAWRGRRLGGMRRIR